MTVARPVAVRVTDQVAVAQSMVAHVTDRVMVARPVAVQATDQVAVARPVDRGPVAAIGMAPAIGPAAGAG